MRKNARLAVTVGTDMEILLSSGKTAADILPVIKEVEEHDRLLTALFKSPCSDLLIHCFALFGRYAKLVGGIGSDRNK